MAFIDLNKMEQAKPIYKYTDFGRVVEMFQKKEMAFVRPDKWDDPFENYLINAEFKFPDGGFIKFPYRQTMFGSCWTRKSVSDAMWRIYSPTKIAVRIKSTPLVIGEALDEALSKSGNSTWHIGKVEYLRQSKIKSKAISIVNQIYSSSKDTPAAKSLLFKRNSFSHEQEVRLIVMDGRSKAKNGVLKVKIDPHKIIQSILVDSRAPDEWLDVYKSFLKNELDFKGSISKSTLYNPIESLVITKNYP